MRGISQKRINGLVSTLFENVDDALFDLAERAGSNAVQTEYFDGMREVRKKRQLVERAVPGTGDARISASSPRASSKPVKPEASTPQASGGLSLVDDTELEESLAVTSMVAKAENRLQRSLYQVNQRLAVIIGGGKVEDANNPIGPAVLGQAFRRRCASSSVNMQVKLIIYKLFDRYVMAGAGTAVRRGQHRADARRRAAADPPRAVRRDSRPMPPPAARMRRRRMAGGCQVDARAMTAAQYYDTAAAELQAELYSTLRSLLAGRHGAPPAAATMPAAVSGAAVSARPNC